MKIKITDGRIIDPATGRDKPGTVCIEDGVIRSVSDSADNSRADLQIDAKGKWVCPGIIDLSARFGEPGQGSRASIASETRAAASAGVTAACCPPDTHPVIDNTAAVELIHQRTEESGKTRIYPIGALTHGLKGERLAEMYALKQAGCVAVSNGNQPVSNNEILRRTFEYAASTGLVVFIQAQDQHLCNQGVVNEGSISTRLGLTPIPETAETVAVSTALLLIEQTGVRAHFCRLSSARAVAMIAKAKQAGLPVTADVGICHLNLTELDVDGYNVNCHLIPPLRRLEDRDALLQGLLNGTLDAVCSDHHPLNEDSKLAPFNLTSPGASTLEVLLPLMLNLIHRKLLTPLQVFEKLAANPARILNLQSGSLATGQAADIIVIDPDQAWTLNNSELLSAGRNCPFDGWELFGKTTHTIINGQLVYPD